MKHILKCIECNKYTIKEVCHGKTIRPVPARYSPEDKYADYRRKAKREMSKTDPALKCGI